MQPKQPYQLSFQAFCERATIQPLKDHGRAAAVCFDGSPLCYVDVLGERGLHQAHKTVVRNALYLRSGFPADGVPRPALPTAEALVAYPDLASEFPIVASLLGFYVERDQLGVLSAKYCFPSDEEKKTLQHVMDAYGYLIERNERVSLLELIDRIISQYDVAEARNRIAVEALRSGAGLSRHISH